jgi:hypothetical protein
MNEQPQSSWSWPARITSFPQLQAAVRSGFDIVLMSDHVWGTSYYVLARDGQRADRNLIRQDIAVAFISRGMMGCGMRLPDGAWLYKRTTQC